MPTHAESKAVILQPSKHDLANENLPPADKSPSPAILGVLGSVALLCVGLRLVVKGRQDLAPRTKKPDPDQITRELY